jgi:hypothetical protein
MAGDTHNLLPVPLAALAFPHVRRQSTRHECGAPIKLNDMFQA